MLITKAQYVLDENESDNEAIIFVLDGQDCSVPLAPGNRHYDEIMRQVAAGTLTIADAD
jgi:hypothetical protein